MIRSFILYVSTQLWPSHERTSQASQSSLMFFLSILDDPHSSSHFLTCLFSIIPQIPSSIRTSIACLSSYATLVTDKFQKKLVWKQWIDKWMYIIIFTCPIFIWFLNTINIHLIIFSKSILFQREKNLKILQSGDKCISF